MSKIIKFATLLKLNFFSRTTYYHHAGNFVYLEINHAWVKKQALQCEEIENSGRRLSLALDRQCDSPGHNASYCTVSSMDTQTNKILHFKVVDVTVSKNVLFVFSLCSCFKK